jgi:ankyrin repeat protein
VRLLQQQPELATVMDEYGSFALHFAAMHRASPEVVTLLLRINGGAAKCFNKSKYLPIHYAAGNGAPPECVALIWHAHPSGADQRNGAGQTAMALATQQNRCDRIAPPRGVLHLRAAAPSDPRVAARSVSARRTWLC